jgi:beta-lactamase class A
MPDAPAWPDAAIRAVDTFAGLPGERSVYLSWLDQDGTAPLTVNATARRPVASLIKPLIVDAVMHRLSPADLDREDVPLADVGRTRYPSVLAVLDRDRRLSVSEICAMSIVTSDNPCASYLLSRFGPDLVRARGEELGLTGTELVTDFGDERLGEAGRRNVSTAEDMARLFGHLYESRRAEPGLWGWLINSLRNNRIPGDLPDEVPVANKTGSLASVVNDAGVIMAGRPLLAVVLTDQQADSAVTSIEISRMILDVASATAIV